MPKFLFSNMMNSPIQEDLIKKTWRGIIYIMATGVVLTLAISLFSPKTSGSNGTFLQMLSTFGCSLLIGGAAFAAGGFGGFIFGIPSLAQNKDSDLKYNDNLIQISDWLTKIIVGVGLVQLNRIPGKISELGDMLKWNFGNGEWGRVASLSIVFYFFLFGFLIIYFWTRTDFTTILKKVDEDLTTKLAKAAEANLALEKKVEVVLDSETARINKERISASEVAFDASTTESIDGKDQKMKEAVAALELKVKEVLTAKNPGSDPADIQKGKWGGKSVSGDKQISAVVTPHSVSGSFYDIAFTISKGKALEEPVALFVHDTFGLPENVIYLKPNEKGVAQVTLMAYEAFTVGVLFLDGTELELDLNNLPGNPPGFNWAPKNPVSLA
jgi:hypothetical protein